MALTAAALNLMGDALGTAATYVSLHSATPDGSGSNQTTAARKSASWSAAASGAKSLSAALDFTGGASNGPVTHAGLWSASTAGTFYGSFAVTGDASFNSAGEYTLDDLTITGS